MRNIIEMQKPLGVCVKIELFDPEQIPPGNSKHFYPEERGICNHMYNTAPKLCMSKVD